jgi:hypothetical protein
MGHGGKLFVGGSTVDVKAGLSVCVCVWAGLVDIWSPHLENIFVRNDFVSEFFIPLPIVFSSCFTLSLLLSFLY